MSTPVPGVLHTKNALSQKGKYIYVCIVVCYSLREKPDTEDLKATLAEMVPV